MISARAKALAALLREKGRLGAVPQYRYDLIDLGRQSLEVGQTTCVFAMCVCSVVLCCVSCCAVYVLCCVCLFCVCLLCVMCVCVLVCLCVKGLAKAAIVLLCAQELLLATGVLVARCCCCDWRATVPACLLPPPRRSMLLRSVAGQLLDRCVGVQGLRRRQVGVERNQAGGRAAGDARRLRRAAQVRRLHGLSCAMQHPVLVRQIMRCTIVKES